MSRRSSSSAGESFKKEGQERKTRETLVLQVGDCMEDRGVLMSLFPTEDSGKGPCLCLLCELSHGHIHLVVQ
jgi:hypothetical protein